MLKKYVIAGLATVFLSICAISAFSLGKKDSSENGEELVKSKTEKKFLKIDLLLDTKNTVKNNHFYWKSKEKKEANSYKDAFDAVSGASKKHSTKYLRASVYEKDTKEFLIPKGLYCLCLFGVADPASMDRDNFKVDLKDNISTITFTHRGISYLIRSDENGLLNVPGSFYIKNSNSTGEEESSEVKTEELKENEEELEAAEDNGKEKDIPQGFIPEVKKQEYKFYNGILKLQLSQEGIFTVKGQLKSQWKIQ